jgi:PAS domain-containing protein
MLCKDGRRVVLEGNVSAHIQEGAPLVTRGIFRDVTTRKIAEEQLATVRERLGLALRGSKLALWDLDVETGRVFMSEDWGAIVGTERRDIVVPIASLTAIIHPDDLPGITAAAFASFQGRAARVSRRTPRPHERRPLEVIQSHGMVTERSATGRALRMTAPTRTSTRASTPKKPWWPLSAGCARSPTACRRRVFSSVVGGQPRSLQLPQRGRAGPARRRTRSDHPRAADVFSAIVKEDRQRVSIRA